MAHRYPVHVSDKWHNLIADEFPLAMDVLDAQAKAWTPDGAVPGEYPPWLGVGQAQLNLAMIYTDLFPPDVRASYLSLDGARLGSAAFEAMFALEEVAYGAGLRGVIPTAEELMLMRDWERSRQVLRFDPDFAEAVAGSSGALPIGTEVFEKLPYDTFFVERESVVCPASWRAEEDGEVVVEPDAVSAGFFVTRTQMGLNPEDPLDLSEQLLVLWVDRKGKRICHEMLSTACASIEEMIEESDDFMRLAAETSREDGILEVPSGDLMDEMNAKLAPARRKRTEEAMALVLYLCSMEPEYEKAAPGGSPKAKRKRGEQAAHLTGDTPVTVVGSSIGAAIRAYWAQADGEPHEKGDGPKVRPHVRRAHFHNHWRGSGEKRELVLMWHAPTFVNAEFGTVQPVTTVHEVGGKKRKKAR